MLHDFEHRATASEAGAVQSGLRRAYTRRTHEAVCVHLKPIVTLPPSAEELDTAAMLLCSALDGMLSSLWTLQPDVTRWDPPVGAIHSAIRRDAACARLQRRLKDALRNLRVVLSEDEEAMIEDVDTEAQELMDAAASVGFRVGVAMLRAAISTQATE